MSLCWLPKRSLLLDEDYSRLSQFAESRGERILQFARSSERGRQVPSGWFHPQPGRCLSAARTENNRVDGDRQQERGIGRSEPKISSKWALAHIKFFFGGK